LHFGRGARPSLFASREPDAVSARFIPADACLAPRRAISPAKYRSETLKFPKTVAACVEAEENFERAQWRIGDALGAETDDKITGPRGMKAVVAELKTVKDEGFDFARLSGGTFPLFLPPAPTFAAVERVLYGPTDEIGSLSRRQ
jgi:hypothetical protein